MTIDPRVRAELLRAELGDGPASLVFLPKAPSMTVWVDGAWLPLAAADLTNPRIDRVCITPQPGGGVLAQILTGTPAPIPVAPSTPDGALSVSTIRVDRAACTVCARDIRQHRVETL